MKRSLATLAAGASTTTKNAPNVRVKQPPTAAALAALHLPRISANSVAGLIGAHTYQSPQEALYEVIKRQAKESTLHQLLRDTEFTLRRRSKFFLRKILLERDEEMQELLRHYSMGLEKTKSTQEALELYQHEYQHMLESLEGKKKRDDDGSRSSDVASLWKGLTMQDTTTILSSAFQTVHQQRGTRLETNSIEQYETQKQAVVTQRNSQMLKKVFLPHFLLTGKIDGYDEATNTIVEIKTRATDNGEGSSDDDDGGGENSSPAPTPFSAPFPPPPHTSALGSRRGENNKSHQATNSVLLPKPPLSGGGPRLHDIIQVRCYLEMKPEAQKAEISEHFQTGPARVTQVWKNKEEWDFIYEGLLQVAGNMKLFESNAEFRKEIVRAATVDVSNLNLYPTKKSSSTLSSSTVVPASSANATRVPSYKKKETVEAAPRLLFSTLHQQTVMLEPSTKTASEEEQEQEQSNLGIDIPGLSHPFR